MRKVAASKQAVYAALVLAVSVLAPMVAMGATGKPPARQAARQTARNAAQAVASPALPVTPATAFVSAMVRIPAGTFLMGAAPRDAKAWASELPVHEVTVPAFELAMYEVTVGQWDLYTAENPKAAPGCGDTPRHATGCIGWSDAQGYLEWLKGKTGIEYRLPSEAEWEYAARAGVTTRYPWGDSPKQACKHAHVYPCGELAKHEVGLLPPNRFGLYDVIGNVWEWTQDCWNDNYHGAPVDGSAWLSGDCRNRVMRGGSFDELPLNYRLSMRGRGLHTPRGDFQGLRLARSVAVVAAP